MKGLTGAFLFKWPSEWQRAKKKHIMGSENRLYFEAELLKKLKTLATEFDGVTVTKNTLKFKHKEDMLPICIWITLYVLTGISALVCLNRRVNITAISKHDFLYSDGADFVSEKIARVFCVYSFVKKSQHYFVGPTCSSA